MHAVGTTLVEGGQARWLAALVDDRDQVGLDHVLGKLLRSVCEQLRLPQGV